MPGRASCYRRRHLQRVMKGSPSDTFGPPVANERTRPVGTFTPNLSGADAEGTIRARRLPQDQEVRPLIYGGSATTSAPKI